MPKVSFRMASASRESVFGVQTNTARKIHRSDRTEGRLTTARSGCCVRKGSPNGTAVGSAQVHNASARLAAHRAPALDETQSSAPAPTSLPRWGDERASHAWPPNRARTWGATRLSAQNSGASVGGCSVVGGRLAEHPAPTRRRGHGGRDLARATDA